MDHYFFPGGIVNEKKIVCMRKNAEINCLLQRSIWKKLSAEITYVMQDLGNLKKIVCTARVEEKTCKHSVDDGKNFLPPRNHDPPGQNNGPSLKILSNSGQQKPLKSSEFRIFSEMLTSSKLFVKFQCFHKKITKSMFSPKKHQLTLNINVRKKEKKNMKILCKYSERYVVTKE